MGTPKKFRKGQIVKFKPRDPYQWGAKAGARAIVKDITEEEFSLIVEWIRDEKAGEQMNGGYDPEDFIPVNPDWDE